ncbi:aspartate/glutamate racemase family protein [uncultured Nitratireductor sp.]|uniref:aspartate/glutamate racemase family protein n=1 Tax=uncultured Nitratireductor sp. TaxID=520953 RepID=UPI0025D2BEB4|nr:aspartate/glutamate racemase family protein [uncultured Nitratireductor sp.]
MNIFVVNPNTSGSMTATIAAAAQAVAAPGTHIMTSNPQDGPPSIEGYADGAYAVPGMLDLLRGAERDGCDGYIIACFDDTGLDAARSCVSGPVVGIGEAGFHCASLIANRFSVVTTLAQSIPIIEHNLLRYGLATRCAAVRTAEIPVLDLEENRAAALHAIGTEIARARHEDGCEAIVLGCSGMADFTDELSEIGGIPVIEGTSCAVKLVEGLLSLGLKTSKACGYASPRPKRFAGSLASASFTTPTGREGRN